MLLINGFTASAQPPRVEILAKNNLPYLTTSNGLETYKRNLIAIGNGATEMLLLDTLLQVRDTFKIISPQNFQQVSGKHIIDMSTTAIVKFNGEDVLLIMANKYIASTASSIYLLPLNIRGRKEILVQSFSINDFFRRLRKKGLKQININGSSGFGNKMVLCISGKNKGSNNHLVVCDTDFWQKGNSAEYSIVPVKMQQPGLHFTGLSYAEELDILLFTATGTGQEITSNYAGSIRNARSRLAKGKTVVPDVLISTDDLVEEKLKGSLQSLSVDLARDNTIILYLLENKPHESSTIYRVKLSLSNPAEN